MSPDVTPESTKVKNRLRRSTPANMVIEWGGETLKFSDMYFRQGLRRDAVLRFADSERRVHYDEGTQQFIGVNLADGSRTLLEPEAVKENRIVLRG